MLVLGDEEAVDDELDIELDGEEGTEEELQLELDAALSFLLRSCFSRVFSGSLRKMHSLPRIQHFVQGKVRLHLILLSAHA